MDLNTCFATTADYHSIAYYSHLIPVFISVVLCIFTLAKSRSLLSIKIFSVFVSGFCLWLIGDVILWTFTDYDLISFIWAPLDYINILFYIFALYFLMVLVGGKDIRLWQKLLLFGISLPAWWITITGQAVQVFYQPVCEAFNSDFLTEYKLIVEIFVLVCIILISAFEFFKGSHQRKKQIVIVSSALILFLGTFLVTEYISSRTGIYEINLYSLFVLPVFLFMIIYSVTNLQIFRLRLMGTQLLTYVMIIFVGSQFFFLENTTNQILTIVTFILALSFGVLLARDAKREVEQRERIEKLATELQKANDRLRELDRQKSEFVSFATHQLRAPLTAMKGYASMILEGDLGDLSATTKNAVERIYESSSTLANVVDDYLNISRIELGTMKYNFDRVNLKDLVVEVIAELQPNIDRSGVKFSFSSSSGPFVARADKDKIKQVIANLVDNSIKYTPKGKVAASLSVASEGGKSVVRFETNDDGIGIASGVLPKLFSKFTRSENGTRTNIHGTGLGLYVAKEIVGAHHGKIWAESAGEGKGSRFVVELPVG